MATLSTFTRWVDGQTLVHSDTDGWWLETDGILDMINEVSINAAGSNSTLTKIGLSPKIFTIQILPGDNTISESLAITRFFSARSKYTLSSALLVPASGADIPDDIVFVVQSVEFTGLNNSPISITCSAMAADLLKTTPVILSTETVLAGETPTTVTDPSVDLTSQGEHELVVTYQKAASGTAGFRTTTVVEMSVDGSVDRQVAVKLGIPDVITGLRALIVNRLQFTSLRPSEPGLLLVPALTSGLFTVRNGDAVEVSWNNLVSTTSDIIITVSLVAPTRLLTPGDWFGGAS